MQDFFEWIERLDALDKPSDEPSPPNLNVRYHRLAAPTALDFEDSVMRVLGTDQQVDLFGDLPGFLSVLCWADTSTSGPSETLRDQRIATGLGGLFTLALDRRVRVASTEATVAMQGTDIKHFLPAQVNDRELTGPLPNEPKAQIERLLARVMGLPEDDRKTLGAAIELHYAAALLHDVELNAAYALVVAALETLSRRYGQVATEWAHWEHANRFDGVFNDLGLTAEQADRFRNELLQDKHLRLRQGFAAYVCARLPNDFWNGEVVDYLPTMELNNDGEGGIKALERAGSISMRQIVPEDLDVLRRRLLAAYDARSLYVHAGGKTLDTMSALKAMIPMPVDRKEPLSFAGIRRILVALIRHEIEVHTTPREIPPLRLFHQQAG